MPKVIVTMPAYNAARTLERTLLDLPAQIADEIILVDDASPDETASLARELGIRVFVHPTNRGYGGNQKTCYREAIREGADIVVMLHPDYQYDPKAVPLLIAPILAGDADMTFGSRFAGLGDPLAGGMPMYRYLGNRLTTTVENLLLGSRFTDMHSGMRAYSRRCLLSLPFLTYSDDFAFDTELLVDAVTSDQRVVEVPIPTRYTKESSSISVSRSLRYVSASVAYTARTVMQRGRRGRAWPPNRRRRPRPLLKSIGEGPSRACVLCGNDRQDLVYPATAEGSVPISEFACTTDALGQHDDIIQCSQCGLLSAAPPSLTDRELLQGYEDVVDEQYLAEEEERRRVFSWFLDAMSGHYIRGDRLMEVGSNAGLFLHQAASFGWKAWGLEPSRWAVETGRARYGVDLTQGNIEDIEFRDEQADAIVMLDVLEHLSDPVKALDRLRPRLNEDGILVLSTVNVRSLHGRLRGASWPWFIRSHLYYFSPETLVEMLRATGFQVVHWATVPRAFHLSYLAARGGEHLGVLGKAMESTSKIVDPKVPVGWLGDIALVVARGARPPRG